MKIIEGTKASFRLFSQPRTIAFAAMLLALNVILTRILSIQTSFLRISFGFLPIAVFAMLYGPVPGALAAVLGDVVGFLLFPKGLYFPGFTLSAFFYGLIYGLFLYGNEKPLQGIIVANLISVILVDICLNTWWLTILNHTGFSVIIIPRLIKSLVLLPVQIIVIALFDRYVGSRLKLMFQLQQKA